jgi:hypothetical protein
VLTADECRRLIDAAGQNHFRLYRTRDRVLLKLLAIVGLRRGELVAASVADYDCDERTLVVPLSKGRKSRVIPLPPDLCADIDAWLTVRPPGKHRGLLTTRTGRPLSTTCIYRALHRAVKAAGLEGRGITPHVLRHTAATLVLRSSRDLVATSRLLGHSSVAVTGDTYCHLTHDDLRRAVNCHPLADRSETTDGALDPRLAPLSLLVPAQNADLLTEAEEAADAAVEGYRRLAEEAPTRHERLRCQGQESAESWAVPTAWIDSGTPRDVNREGAALAGGCPSDSFHPRCFHPAVGGRHGVPRAASRRREGPALLRRSEGVWIVRQRPQRSCGGDLSRRETPSAPEPRGIRLLSAGRQHLRHPGSGTPEQPGSPVRRRVWPGSSSGNGSRATSVHQATAIGGANWSVTHPNGSRAREPARTGARASGRGHPATPATSRHSSAWNQFAKSSRMAHHTGWLVWRLSRAPCIRRRPSSCGSRPTGGASSIRAVLPCWEGPLSAFVSAFLAVPSVGVEQVAHDGAKQDNPDLGSMARRERSGLLRTCPSIALMVPWTAGRD